MNKIQPFYISSSSSFDYQSLICTAAYNQKFALSLIIGDAMKEHHRFTINPTQADIPPQS